MSEPIIVIPSASGVRPQVTADGNSFVLREWRGSCPSKLHGHHRDDEAWHVLEGSLHFRFGDRDLDAPAGSTVFVPAGVPHTYQAYNARYLIIMSPRLATLIAELQSARDPSTHGAIYRKYDSALLE